MNWYEGKEEVGIMGGFHFHKCYEKELHKIWKVNSDGKRKLVRGQACTGKIKNHTANGANTPQPLSKFE